MIFKKHRPLYREVLREAFAFTWHERHLWILALFAGILQTGGIYDVILQSAGLLSQQVQYLAANGAATPFAGWAFSGEKLSWFPTVLSFTQAVETALFAIIALLVILGISVIAQGGLVYGLSTRIKSRAPSLRACLTIGARNIWPIAGLNAITLGCIFLARFLVLIPYTYSITNPSFFTVALYFLAFLVFLALVVLVTAIHLFALNAIVLDRVSLHAAIVSSYRLFQRSWLTVIELGAMLFVIGAGLLALVILLLIIAGIPLFLLIVTAATMRWDVVVDLTYGVGVGVTLGAMLVAGAAAITFQYATWQRLYLRAGQGSAVAKISRWLHWLFPSLN
ncbi:MAG: hypothetical protein WCV84_04900 [Patescibacteria group bacterium]